MKDSNINNTRDYLPRGRLFVVSNRLPVSLKNDNGKWSIYSSTGGLVTAITSVLKRQEGIWIGWPGTLNKVDLERLLEGSTIKAGYTLEPVWLDKDEVSRYYFGFSNEVIWPLFHDIQSSCNFDPSYWEMYCAVNGKFAKKISCNIENNDYIWIHDYHLMMAAHELRRLGTGNRIGFFLHIPFPSPDMYMKLPWRMEILRALLEYDLVGFQTLRDRNNFIHCVDIMIKGHAADIRRNIAVIKTQNHKTMAGSFPISIDFRQFASQAATRAVDEKARRLRSASSNRQIILGLDRLDYSKGIPERLRGFGDALKRFPELIEKVTMVQVVVPSREDVSAYTHLRTEIERIAGKLNGEFTEPGWVPIHYMYRSLDRVELLAYYRAADIALITPLKDGMNLVSKEYCAAKVDKDGVLILSEFAGAASQLHRDCLLVNPYDIKGIGDQIYRAFAMSKDERRMRMRRLRNLIARRDIFWWVEEFLSAAHREYR